MVEVCLQIFRYNHSSTAFADKIEIAVAEQLYMGDSSERANLQVG